MAIEFPWPESPDRVRARVGAIVDSVVRDDELHGMRLEWVTPLDHRLDRADADWIALRLTVSASDDECFESEIWGPDWHTDWDGSLHDLAGSLEDWVCETSFAWGQQRIAVVPE